MARTVTARTRAGSRSRGTARSSTRRVRSRRPGRSRTAPADQGDVQAFLDRFTAALTSGDGEGAAACFELPSLVIMADRKYGPSQVLEDPATVASFFAGATRMYAEQGIATTLADLERLEWLDDGLALVHVRFPYIDADGLDRGDGETSVYVLRREGGDLHILAAIALGTDADRMARRRGHPLGDAGDQRT